MKKIVSILLTGVAASAMFLSCQKENFSEQHYDATHTVHFTVTNEESISKTVISADGKSASWSAKDTAYFNVYEDGVKAVSRKATISGGIVTIDAVFKGEADASSHTYSATFASDLSGKNPQILKLQKPASESFDPAADILFAKPVTATAAKAAEGLVFQFKRVVAINRMKLKGIQSGEVIKKVTISADKSLCGSYKFDTEEFNPGDKQLECETSSDVVYFITGGCSDNLYSSVCKDLSLKVIVTTDKATYTKPLADVVSFHAGALTKFSVTFDDSHRTTTRRFNLVTNINDLSAGDIIVIGCKSEQRVAGPLDVQKYLSAQEAKIENGVLETSAPVEQIELGKSENGNWTLSTSSGLLGAKAAKDLAYNKGTTEWKITVTADSTTISSTTSTYGSIKYNSSSPRFLNYASGQKTIEIYKIDDDRISLAKPEITVTTNDDAKTATVSWGAVANATSYSVSCTGKESKTTSATSVTFTDLAPGNYTVSVTAKGSAAYRESTSSKNFTIVSNETLSTMDQIFAAATTAGSTATSVKVKFSDWVVSGVKGSNAYLTDGTKGLIIYGSSHGFAVGDKLSGSVSCKVQLYNGSSELTSLTSTTTGLTVTKGGTVTPVKIPIADLSGVNTGALVTFESLTYNGSLFSDGANTIKPYNTFITLPTFVSGNEYKITGVFIQYGDTKEIAPRSNDDIVSLSKFLYATAGKTSVAAEGETITVDVDTNVDSWTATSSDNTNFAISNKTENSFQVVVSANTSTTSSRTATITVSASGADDVQIVLTQVKKGGSADVTETLVIKDYATANAWGNGKPYTSASTANVTYTASGTGNNCKYYSSDQSWRFYKTGDGVLTITVPNGKIIKKIVMTGTLNLNVPSGWSFKDKTFTPNQGTSTNTVSISNNTSNTSQIQTIAVTYGE